MSAEVGAESTTSYLGLLSVYETHELDEATPKDTLRAELPDARHVADKIVALLRNLQGDITLGRPLLADKGKILCELLDQLQQGGAIIASALEDEARSTALE